MAGVSFIHTALHSPRKLGDIFISKMRTQIFSCPFSKSASGGARFSGSGALVLTLNQRADNKALTYWSLVLDSRKEYGSERIL